MIACSAIMIKTLVGYSEFCLSGKLLTSFLIVIGWISPLLLGWIRKHNYIDGMLYQYIHNIGYYLFGLVFILFILLIFRDIIWFASYMVAKSFKADVPWLNPLNAAMLTRANIVTFLLSLCISFYAVYEAVRIPRVKKIEYTSSIIQNDYNIVQLSDLHINRASSKDWLKNVINTANTLNPDIIVLTGDVIDDRMKYLDEYMDILQQLKAKYGIYFSMGNHEYYNDLPSILRKLHKMPIKILLNEGINVDNSELFIAGIPDKHTAITNSYLAADFKKILKNVNKNNYRILLSHSPDMVEHVTKDAFDLVLSGHTHGGQIFPFNYLAQKANKYLAGSYKVNGVDLYVSRGTGFWGPPLRLLADSEITVITVKSQNKQEE